MDVSLRSVTFHSAVSASTNGTWVGVNGTYGGVQQRSIIGIKSSDDIVDVQVRINDGSFSVISTATAWVSGITHFSTIVQGPFHDIRVRKLGTHGAVDVIGLV